MTWLLWRQNRGGILVWCLGLVALVILIAFAIWRVATQIVGLDLEACLQSSGSGPSITCQLTFPAFITFFDRMDRLIYVTLVPLPALAAGFVGAPLLAREFEQGTHRLVWTQGITRRRWLASKVAAALALALVTVTILGAVTLPWTLLLTRVEPAWDRFDLYTPALASYMAFAVAVGLAAGALLGRTVMAMAVALAGFAVSRVGFELWLRPRLFPPLTSEGMLRGNGHDWFLYARYLDSAGHEVSNDYVLNIITRPGNEGLATLKQQGISLVGFYHPASQFWAFQTVEAAFFLVLAAGLIVMTFWWVERRLT